MHLSLKPKIKYFVRKELQITLFFLGRSYNSKILFRGLLTFSSFLFQVVCVHSLTECGLPGLESSRLAWPRENDLAGSGLNGRYTDLHDLASVVQWNMVS